MKKPNVYIIAGPNGSGKTTFAAQFLPKFVNCPEFVNADLLAQGLSPFAPEGAAIQAGRLMLERIDSLAAKNVDFGFETTLSGKIFLRLIDRLRKQGYQIHIYYLWLPDVTLAVRRVAERVRKGGHNIPGETIKRRYRAGLKNFVLKYSLVADTWILFDNSMAQPQVIAAFRDKKLEIEDELLYNAARFEASK